MRRKRNLIFIFILLLAAGFAAVSTNLYINGTSKISHKTDDFIDGVQFNPSSIDVSSGVNYSISESGRTITFTTQKMTGIGSSATIKYTIVNNSQYDATINAMDCYFVSSNVVDEEATPTSTTNEYLTVVPSTDLVGTIIKANGEETSEATITVTQVKSYPSKTDTEIKYQCKINATGTESINPGIGELDSNDLYDKVIALNKGTISDFNVNSSTGNTNGVYVTYETDSGTPVYYYRGSVDNNIILGNYCWKIVRTTETGGVKLIYNGAQLNDQCLTQTGTGTQITVDGSVFFNWDSKKDDAAYVGYMYGINTGSSTSKEQAQTNTYSSLAKTKVEEWYSTHMLSYQDYLEDTVFCNDRSTIAAGNNNALGNNYGILGYGTALTSYGANSRATYFTKIVNPTLKCMQNNDKFTVSSTIGNGKLSYPIGLITLDEAAFAGYNSYYSNSGDYKNTNIYLHTTRDYWTMTPVYNAANGSNMGSIASTGFLDARGNLSEFGLRPVISLKSGTKVSATGIGTPENPYIVVMN